MTASDAVAREVAWLRTTGDSLPSLLGPAGPWSVIQAYRTRTPSTRLSGIYLLRSGYVEERWGNQRKIIRHSFVADLVWPIGSTATAAQIWETEQAALDVAVDLLVQRIRGLLFDHTHGGRFLSAAEAPDPAQINVTFTDPAQTATATPACLSASVRWETDEQIIA